MGFFFGGDIFYILFMVMFVSIFAIVMITILNELFTWNKNNHSPVLTVYATVIDKRENYRHRSGGVNHVGSSVTLYYVSFEVESGDRMEFRVRGDEYGLLVKGDQGQLTFQGTRYLSFERETNDIYYDDSRYQ